VASPTLIRAFVVGPAGDDEFLAWRARTGGGGTLLRALRADVELRFVELGADRSESPFPVHAADYELAHEDGDHGVAGGTVLIDPFEVPGDGDARFVAACARLRERFALRRGYLGSRLYRSDGPATFRFVQLVRWSSPLMFARALDDPAVAAAIEAVPFTSRPALYTAVAQR
jgi:hypothetical protein